MTRLSLAGLKRDAAHEAACGAFGQLVQGMPRLESLAFYNVRFTSEQTEELARAVSALPALRTVRCVRANHGGAQAECLDAIAGRAVFI